MTDREMLLLVRDILKQGQLEEQYALAKFIDEHIAKTKKKGKKNG